MSAKKAQPSKKMVPLSEVGGALVSYAEEHASPQRASEVEAEVQKFIDALPDAAPTPALDAAHDRFLARAKKLVSADVYRQLEQAYRASKKTPPSQERADRRLYLRYRNDPERQEVAPVLTRLAREAETPAKKAQPPTRDPYLTLPPETVDAMRAYEARTYGGDVRKILTPPKKARATDADMARLRDMLEAIRKDCDQLVRRVDKIVRDLVCAKCGYLGRQHYWRIADFCDRCLRDQRPATGYRSRTHRHPFVAEVAKR